MEEFPVTPEKPTTTRTRIMSENCWSIQTAWPVACRQVDNGLVFDEMALSYEAASAEIAKEHAARQMARHLLLVVK